MIEDKKNELNLNLRKILRLLDIINDMKDVPYPNYEPGTLTDEEYFDQQNALAIEINDRLTNIFKS
ncbi:MAG: hypothetical protein ACI31R_03390 [Bacilli bacterium]